MGSPDFLSAQLPLILAAGEEVSPQFVEKYIRLKQLLSENTADAIASFKDEYAQFYRVNGAGFSRDLRAKYFDRLLALRGFTGAPPYGELMREFYNIPRARGDNVLHFSFVSKLIAMLDESYPIYDDNVGAFFGLKAPWLGSLDYRIAGCIAHLDAIKRYYSAWIADERFQPALHRVCERIPQLAGCHLIRVCDFLVWTVGDGL